MLLTNKKGKNMKVLIFSTYMQMSEPQINNYQINQITEQERNRNIRKQKWKTFGTAVAFTALSGAICFGPVYFPTMFNRE